MGNLRETGRPGPLRACLGSVAAAVLALAGCTTGETVLLRVGSPADGPPEMIPAADPKPARKPACVACQAQQGAGGSPDDKQKPPTPHTVFEAIHSYCDCLHNPFDPRREPEADKKDKDEKDKKEKDDKDKKNDNDKKKDEKGPPAAGDRSQVKEDRDEKSPPAAGKQDQKQGKGKKEEKDKEKKEDDQDKKEEAEEAKWDWLSAHAQATVITQAHDHFRSPYQGPLSLPPVEPAATSETTTLFLAFRLWECDDCPGDLVFNPEVAGGRGFGGNANGIADFPNGEITRVGVPEPTPYIARLFYRQVLGFGGEQEKVEDAVNQVAGLRDVDRLTVIVGKLAATDTFDDNKYSHDPRTSFLPWALVWNGAWDYPANVRGYTYGVTLDYNEKCWALRYGIFAVARFANSGQLDPNFLRANGQILEWERRYCLGGHPGKLRLWGYLNRAHMGSYNEAVNLMPVDPNVTLTRAYRIKYGFGGNIEQEITRDLGAFVKFGGNDGRTETWMFTPIDATFVAGLVLKGRCWCRPDDTVGLAAACDGLAGPHQGYLASGGLDFNIGDGALNYGLEETLETFYNLQIRKGIFFATDLQWINNPAYNRDRGPVVVITGRLHLEI